MEDEKDNKMAEEPISEDALITELDTMYKHVADIEKKEEEDTEILDFLKERPAQKKEKKTRSYRILILGIIASLLASALVMTLLWPMIPFQLLKKDKINSPSIVVHPPRKKPSPRPAPVQKAQNPVQTAQEETKKDNPVVQEPPPAELPTPQGKFYTIQVGIFRNQENVQRLLRIFKEDGLEAYQITMKSRKRVPLYKVFIGRFTDKEKAAQFLKDKKILKDYPESFVHEVSTSEINQSDIVGI